METLCKKIESIAEYTDAIRLRVDVFILEQNCPVGLEPDEKDSSAEHYAAIVLDQVVCTGRTRETTSGEFKIERIATRKDMRRKGIGKELVSFILKNLQKNSPSKIYLESQTQACAFYEKLGFKRISEQFELDGIPHIKMELQA